MERIESFTKEQEAEYGQFVRRWTEIGLSTAPADRPRAEAAIRKVYEAAGLPHPQKIVWCGSPLSQGLARASILNNEIPNSPTWLIPSTVGISVLAGITGSTGVDVGASLRDKIWGSIKISVKANVGACLWDHIWASGARAIINPIAASIWDIARNAPDGEIWKSLRVSLGETAYCQHDTGWLAFYHFFGEALNLPDQTKEQVAALFELSQSAGWFLPHQGICWVTERHNILARDDQGRLHSTSGPAVAYPDGWAVYAVHGESYMKEVQE